MNKINDMVSITDFKPDISFFDDLREGNYCLVLGAGFSFGVKNKNTEFNTIPTALQFIKFTNEKFGKEVTEYKAAASVWENKIKENPDLLNELRNLFLVDETTFNFPLFDSIFIPNWYSIFTFNFDNVLTTTQSKHKGKKYPIFYYPKHPKDNNNDSILHLHGLINDETNLNDIVFTSSSYSKLGAEQNSLYNVIYGDIETNSKNLLIVGTQFNEQIVFDKFFKGLRRDDLKIYHFDLVNDDVAEKPEFNNRDYTFIKLYKDEDNKGTKLFLQFLEDNKDEIENIHIEGADVINSTFTKNIRDGKQFTKTDFYTAKQDESCQWYGIINNYDVVRNDYYEIKEIAKSCFDKPRTFKVVAVVHGFGGCGKSTLLRRLAVELSNEPFKIIWAKDREFEQLTNEGLKQIQNDPFRNYLIIIEDWYRLTDNLKEKAKEFLLKTQTLNNIRIIIGDREITGKDYIDNLPEKSNIFHLESTENEKIIAEIIELHAEWKDVKEKVIKKKEDYNTSLFLLLFVIARVSNEAFDNTEIDFSEPGLAFKSIVKSDLKKINDEYPGIAKTLHNWACIYTNYKIFIDFETFLRIGDAYNGNDYVSNYLKNWNANSQLLDRIKNYINTGRNTSFKNKKLHQIDFVQFNHDKLAEEGLAEVVLDDWKDFYNPSTKRYDDLLLKQFLNIVIDNYTKGNYYFSSTFIAILMQHQKQIFADGKDKLFFINLLFEKGNLHSTYLNHLSDEDINLAPAQIKGYLDKLYEKKVYPFAVWANYFKNASKEEKQLAAQKILNDPNVTSLQPTILIAAFNQKGNEVEKRQAAQKILVAPNITSIIHHSVVAAFNQKGNEAEKQQAAQKILVDPNITSLQYNIVIAAFNQKGNEVEKEKVAQKILVDPNIISLQPNIVVAAFNQKGNEVEKQQAAQKILVDPNMTSLIPEIVIAAFNQKGNEVEKRQAAQKILVAPNITSIIHHSVIAAFNQKGNEVEKKNLAQKILVDPNIISLQPDIVVAAFKQKGNEAEKQQAAQKILVDPNITSLQQYTVAAAFNQNGNEVEKQQAAQKILVDPNITSLQQFTVVAAFNQKGNEVEKQQAAQKILVDPNWNTTKNLFPFLSALRYFSSSKIVPDFVRTRIHTVIDNFFKDFNVKLQRDFYYGLMNIPYHQNKLWKGQSEYIITNWSKIERRAITNVLYGYRAYPDSIKNVCKIIMNDWRNEIGQKVFQVYGAPNIGGHIRISLGHPALKSLAKKTAEEIVKAKENNSVAIPDYLFEIAEKIVNEDNYPEWKFNDNNESDTE